MIVFVALTLACVCWQYRDLSDPWHLRPPQTIPPLLWSNKPLKGEEVCLLEGRIYWQFPFSEMASE